jgi:signal transduction histidine kinase/DNA-binding response OmpR family regulator
MAITPMKLIFAFILVLVLGPFLGLSAQAKIVPYDESKALWQSIETLLGQPDAKAAQFSRFKKMTPNALLSKAEEFIVSFKNDSAVLISYQMLHQLKQKNQLESPLGLKGQLVLARALEHNDVDSISMRLLTHVMESCEQKGPWDTYVKSCLSLALLYEYVHKPEPCLHYLNRAKRAIVKYHLHANYPLYAMRRCSYYRVLTGQLDSARFYAQEVLRTAPAHNLVLEEAWGHMLMAFLTIRDKDSQYLMHFQKASKLFEKIDDYTGLSYVQHNLANWYFQLGNLKEALACNEASILASQKSIAGGNKWNATLYQAYRLKAALFKKEGRQDAAWQYLEKSYQVELGFQQEKEKARDKEIDARYQNEKRAKQIQDQAATIKVEKRERRLLLAIFVITLLLAAGLAFGLVKYRTEQRILAEKNQIIEQQSSELKSLDAAKTRFFANISHELRTPLTLLLGAISSIRKEQQLSEKQEKLLELAKRGGDDLGRLIHDILDLGKLDSGKMSLNLEPEPLAPFFSNYFAQFESLAEQKGVQFSFETSLETNQGALIDREKCRQIVYNLLSNAFKFTPGGGAVRGNLRVENGNLFLKITDTGDGIHPDDLPHVFERYFQTQQENAPLKGGTGIGLALCYEYARLLGGKIEVKSRLGQGTEFELSFPITLLETKADLSAIAELQADETLPGAASAGSVLAEKNAASKPVLEQDKPQILVVEDNFELQAYIRTVLEEKYQVVCAEHGQAALDFLSRANKVQLIISDLMMPVMDGYQLLEKLKSRELTRQLPVIMLTARAEARDKLKALRIGVDDYLTKPFEEEELVVRIENLLNNRAVRLQVILPEVSEEKPSPSLSAADQDWLETFEIYVSENLHSDLLNVPNLAHEFHMSESTLLRQLKRLCGLTPQQYLLEMRLDKARELLEARSGLPLAKIAALSGYADVRSFSRSFRQRFGKLPSELLTSFE